MATPRPLTEKVGAWKQAYDAIREEITPPAMRTMLQNMTAANPAAEVGDIQAYAALVQASITLARLVSANDRAAAIAAAMLTQSGVSRPVIDIGEGE